MTLRLRLRRRLRAAMLLGVGAALTGVVLVLALTDPLRQLELDTVDTRFSVRGSQAPPRDLVLVKIDDVTFGDLGVRWPFPRQMHAQVIDSLRRAGARVIVYDVQFTEPASNREDAALMDAVARARGRVVLATSEVDADGGHAVFGGQSTVRSLGARVGNASLPLDRDGVTRRFAAVVDRMPSLATAAVATAERRPVARDELAGDHWIDFHGPPGAVPSVSFSDVFKGRVRPSRLRGKIVLVGATAPSLQDVRPTSVSADRLMSGAEIHANAISSLRRGLPMHEPGGWVGVVLVVLLGMAVPVAALRLRSGWRTIVAMLLLTVATGLLYAGTVQLAFSAGLILPLVYPLVALVLSGIGVLAVETLVALTERELVRSLFTRYVPESVVDEVLKATDENLCLTGRVMQSTIVVTDIRGFTSFNEGRPAEDVILVLNRFLGEMTEAILDHGGTLLGYRGDGIFAAFGAPIEQPDHADRALAAVREIAGPRLDAFNAWLAEHDHGDPFRIGVGVNSGRIVSGHVGCEVRVEYTAIGDPVNTAFRLEELTKELPCTVLISSTTQAMLRGPAPDLHFVDSTVVRGKEVKVGLWTLGSASGEQPPGFRRGAGAEEAVADPALTASDLQRS